jgi:hypothetical protein
MLAREFPDLDLHFLHQHGACLETPQPLTNLSSRPIINKPLSPQTEDSNKPFGFHFDGYCSPTFTVGGQDSTRSSRDAPFSFCYRDQVRDRLKYRTETFVRYGPVWYRSSTRISCCMLSPNLCMSRLRLMHMASINLRTDLVLVDSPLRFDGYAHVNVRDAAKNSSSPALPKDPHDRESWRGFKPITSLLRTFDCFSPHEILNFMSTKTTPDDKRDATFHCLLVVSDWQFLVDEMERKMRELQSLASWSVDKTTLNDMRAFRRILAAARETIADNETQHANCDWHRDEEKRWRDGELKHDIFCYMRVRRLL